MFRQATNKVFIEGILSEINLEKRNYTNKSGEPTEAIGGNIKVLVEQGEATYEVPVYMFANRYTLAGKENSAYNSIKTVMDEYSSIAAVGKDAADRIRIGSGVVKMNDFVGRNGEIVSQPRVHASFVSKVLRNFTPKAEFELEVVFQDALRVVDRDGVELDPPKLKVNAIVPGYTAPSASVMNLEVVPLIAYSPVAINAIEQNWEKGKTYKVFGRLNFTSVVREVTEEVGFGDPVVKTYTNSISEFVIEKGSTVPLDEEYAFNVNDIREGMAARKSRLEAKKLEGVKVNKIDAKPELGNFKKTTGPIGEIIPPQKPISKIDDLGF